MGCPHGLVSCIHCAGYEHMESTIALLTRERDEARTEVERAEAERQALADVMGELDAWGCTCAFGGLPENSGACLKCKCIAAHADAISALRERDGARAEVERERAAVVAWIRRGPDEDSETHWSPSSVAAAIEAGEHRK